MWAITKDATIMFMAAMVNVTLTHSLLRLTS